MVIKTPTFSGWWLSGKDAEAFLKQISDSKPNPLVHATFVRGHRNISLKDVYVFARRKAIIARIFLNNNKVNV